MKMDIKAQPFLEFERIATQLQPRIQSHSATRQDGLSCISVAVLKPDFSAPGSTELCLVV